MNEDYIITIESTPIVGKLRKLKANYSFTIEPIMCADGDDPEILAQFVEALTTEIDYKSIHKC